MKTITKTFYVSDLGLSRIKNQDGNIDISKYMNEYFINKIQVSWQEPGRRIEITESQIDELKSKYPNGLISLGIFKKEIFGEKNEWWKFWPSI